MPRGQTITFTPVPPAALQLAVVPQEAPAPFMVQGARDETQKAIDEAVLANLLHWQANGQPDFTRASLSRPNCPVQRMRYQFAPEHTEAVKVMLRRAAQYVGCTVIQSDVKASPDGSAMIFWAARAQKARTAQE